ncbi:glycosyltransferase family 2 protein [Salipiger bermudensis]|uniref:glycosyltransferase family 2 protein n=1 Tax=Salipiger bermudensis TaxID=344736 RepID=UPI001C995715|nr:glycosyltransferase family 2 protein [Salipiger bermudensis]MBY6003805.1 glycosyltransferase family 2 protein [Salipiger bermudensis]
MGALPVSVVIVSRGRPGALSLCLTGVAQLDYPAYEVIVVACPEGTATVAARADADRIKLVAFDEPNISAARNLGIAEAAGEVVAFLDDDAVPEPTWLTHLCAPFADPQVAAAGGYVRGRNGIEYQWRAQGVTARAQERDLPLEGTGSRILRGRPGVAVKLQGTNMAHRRRLLAEMGGFDPAFRFFLDETDLDMRHAARGHAVAVVPLAEVHHGYAESPRRAGDRSPRDLTEIGASFAVFLAKHCPEPERRMAWLALRDAQKRRLLRFLQRGPLGPDDVIRLMRGLDRGWREGRARPFGELPPLPASRAPFLAYPGRPGAPRHVLSGRVWNRAGMRREAARRAAEGEIVSAYRFSHTALFHRLRFRPEGYWEQIGGLWGRSDRSGAALQLHGFAQRLRLETARVSAVRDNDERI